MAKYSFEFKKQVIQSYLKGEGGYGYLASKYGVSGKEQIRKWVSSYKTLGDDSLKRSRRKKLFF